MILTFVYVCDVHACVHVHTCEGAKTQMRTCIWMSEVEIQCLPQLPSTVFIEAGFLH